MSMISGLIDKLRKSEREWNQSNMFEIARMCSEAADTIWELRDDLQRANAENAKLREQVHWLKRGDILHVLIDQELADQQKHEREMQASITALDDENAKLRTQIADVTESMGRVEERCAKLRELVCHMHECMSNVDADGNHECFACEYENAECEFDRRMRELGVGVDG